MSVSADLPVDSGPAPVTWLVPTLAFTTFVNTASAVALSPFLPLVADELGASVALLGQIPSLMLLLAAVLGLVIGPLADQYGYRRTLVIALVTVAISTFGTGLAFSFLPLLLVGLVGAIGRAAVMPTAQAVIGTQYLDDDRRRQAISWVATGHTNAVLLGIPLLTTIAAFSHWRVSFLALGGFALASALLLWQMLPADGTRPGTALRLRGFLSAYTPLLHHRSTLALIGQGFFGSIGSLGTFTYIGAFFVQRHGSTTSEVGVAYLAIGVGTVLGVRLVGTRLGARLRPLLLLTRITGALLITAAFMLPLSWLVVVGLLVVGLMAHVANTAATAVLLVGESPAGRATTMTLNSSGLSFGGALGGMLGGMVLAIGDYAALGLVSLASLLAAAALVWWSRPREVLPPPAPAGL